MTGPAIQSIAVVDSHLHFWDPGRFDYPWLRAFPGLDRPFLPADLDVGAVTVESMVFVQANPVWAAAAAETEWVLGLGQRDRRIQALVAGAPLDRGAAAVTSAARRLAQQPGVAGVRQLIQDEAEGFALRPDFVDAVRLVGSYGLVVDLCVRQPQLAEVTQLVEQCPEAIFVLNHLGKPDIRGGQRIEWEQRILALAGFANVRCKLSGLTTEADERTGDVGTLSGYLRAGVEAFGPERCMFGSDWPNASLTITYADWVAIVAGSVADLTIDERDRIFRGTARAVYGRAWS